MLHIKSLHRPNLQCGAFTLGAAESKTVTGASGSGKSQLLRAIADLDPNFGEVFLGDKERASFQANEWRMQVQYVAAESGWWDEAVAAHFDDLNAASQLLPKVRLPEDCLSWMVRRLSSGEKQRLALVRALILKPRVLLLDEPTSALDEFTSEAVENLLLDYCSQGASLLIVSHDAEQAAKFSNSGRLHVVDGIVTEVIT